jgi:hypothetical protein
MTETNHHGVPLPRVVHTPTAAERLTARLPNQHQLADHPVGDYNDEPPDPGLLSEAQIRDPLRSIAVLFRSLTCEQMWKMTGEEGMRKPELEKVFIEWSKAYMEGKPMADITQGRRA